MGDHNQRAIPDCLCALPCTERMCPERKNGPAVTDDDTVLLGVQAGDALEDRCGAGTNLHQRLAPRRTQFAAR